MPLHCVSRGQGAGRPVHPNILISTTEYADCNRVRRPVGPVVAALFRGVQEGIRRVQAFRAVSQQRVRLPITLPMLRAIRATLDASEEPDRELVWAVAALAFNGFF